MKIVMECGCDVLEAETLELDRLSSFRDSVMDSFYQK